MAGDARVLRDLAEEVEGLDGFSRDMNNRIAVATGWLRRTPSECGRRHGDWIAPGDHCGRDSKGRPVLRFDSLHGTEVHREPPNVTGSIDAAAKLMPGRWGTAVRTSNLGWSCWGERPIRLGLSFRKLPEAHAVTEPLARTACALRALAADLEGTDADPA